MAGSQPMSTAVHEHGAPKNFGDLTPYLTYDWYLSIVFINDVRVGTYIYQCCGSGMFIPDPGIPDLDPGSRIPDPETATKERGLKK